MAEPSTIRQLLMRKFHGRSIEWLSRQRAHTATMHVMILNEVACIVPIAQDARRHKHTPQPQLDVVRKSDHTHALHIEYICLIELWMAANQSLPDPVDGWIVHTNTFTQWRPHSHSTKYTLRQLRPVGRWLYIFSFLRNAHRRNWSIT